MRTFFILFFLVLYYFGASQNFKETEIAFLNKIDKSLSKNNKTAIHLVDSFISIKNADNDTTSLAYAHLVKAYAYFFEYDYVNAKINFNRAIAYSKNTNQNIELKAQNALGIVFNKLGNYDDALICFWQSRQLAIQQKNSLSQAKAANNIGVLLRETKQFAKSIQLLNEALQIYDTLNLEPEKAEVYNNLGVSYLALEDLGRAEAFYQKALNIKLKQGNTESLANTYNNLAVLYERKKQFSNAKVFHHKALNIRQNLNYPYGLASSYANLAENNKHINNIDSAFYFVQQAEIIAEKNKFYEILLRVYTTKHNLFEQIGKYKDALGVFELYNAVKDSLFNQKTKESLDKLELKLKTENAEKQIELLKTENQIKQLEVSHKETTLFLLLLILIIVIISGLIIYTRYKKVQTLNSLLNQREKSLIEAKTLAEISNKHKSEFLSNMSHEIRTPLTGIKGIISLLKLDDLNDEQKNLLELAEGSANTLLSIINDILDLARIEAGKLVIKPNPVNLQVLLAEIEQVFKLKATEKALMFSFESQLGLPIWVETDGTRLKQIFYNLIGNAIKFTENGSVAVHVNFDFIDSYTINLKAKIADTGVGIAPNQIEQLFQPFYQASSNVLEPNNGTGLGLSIVQSLLLKFNGKIEVTSQLNFGSTFTFQLPLKVLNATANNLQANEVKPEKGISVLVAEDNLLNQKIMHLCLQKLQAKVKMAISGTEAVNLYKSQKFDLIFMDIRMPEMDGLEATKTIRTYEKTNQLPQTPIIAFTANIMEHDSQNYLNIGMNGFLSKPFTIQEVEALLHKYTTK